MRLGICCSIPFEIMCSKSNKQNETWWALHCPTRNKWIRYCLGKEQSFKIWSRWIVCILGKVFLNLRYIWKREFFSLYPLKTVIFTVNRLNIQDRGKTTVHLRRGSPSHLHRIKLNFNIHKHILWYFVYRRTLREINLLFFCPYNYVMSFCVSWEITYCILAIPISNMHLHDHLEFLQNAIKTIVSLFLSTMLGFFLALFS